MKRYRTNILQEKNLKISRGKVVQVPDKDNSEGKVNEGEATDNLDPGEH